MNELKNIYDVSFCNLEISTGNIIKNKATIISTLNKATTSIVIFPELSLTGYYCNDLFNNDDFIECAKLALFQVLESTTFKGIYIVSLPLRINNLLFNCAVVAKGNQVLGVVPKTFLPNNQEFYEKRWFTSYKDVAHLSEYKKIMLGSAYKNISFGYLIFEVGTLKFAVEICEDGWASITPGDIYALHGCDVIINVSASPQLVGKSAMRKAMVIDHSRKNSTYYLYHSGNKGESTSEALFACESLAGLNGELIYESKFNDDKELFSNFCIDLDFAASAKKNAPTFKDNILLKNYIKPRLIKNAPFKKKANLAFPLLKVEKNPFLDEKKSSFQNDAQEIIDVLVNSLELRIKLLKSKMILGVSGGLDSTMALLICYLVCLKNNLDPNEYLIAVSLPSDVTSENTFKKITSLREIPFKFLEISIRADVEKHLQTIQHEKIDVTYENTQARIRTLYLMNLANKENAIVIGTGDMSEIALGFSTYNGDQMSMYAINSGLPKTCIKMLVRFLAKQPVFAKIKDALLYIADDAITPELLKDQKTEGLIGSYEINDFIMYYHLSFGVSDMKMIKYIILVFNISEELATDYVKKYYKRFYNSQFKRTTLPEGPKIFSVNLSPRTSFRLPSDLDLGSNY